MLTHKIFYFIFFQALSKACKENNIAAVQLLIEDGVDINVANKVSEIFYQ